LLDVSINFVVAFFFFFEFWSKMFSPFFLPCLYVQLTYLTLKYVTLCWRCLGWLSLQYLTLIQSDWLATQPYYSTIFSLNLNSNVPRQVGKRWIYGKIKFDVG
jgi:hypothetical protein